MPARGKALVKTELSIAIPEGTYARVGEWLFGGITAFVRVVEAGGLLKSRH